MVATTPRDVIAHDESAQRLRRRRKINKILASMMSHVILLALSVFAIVPLVWTVASAFKPKSEIMTNPGLIPNSPTLTHFNFVLRETDFPLWMRNSLQLAVATAALSLVVGSLGGYAMSRWRFRGRTLYGNTHHIGGVQYPDCKHVKPRPGGGVQTPFHSTDDNSWRRYFAVEFRGLFPEPSRYEKDGAW